MAYRARNEAVGDSTPTAGGSGSNPHRAKVFTASRNEDFSTGAWEHLTRTSPGSRWARPITGGN